MTDDEYCTNPLQPVTPNKTEFKPPKSTDTSLSSDSKSFYPDESMSNKEAVDAVVRLNENDDTKIRLESSNVSLTLSIKMVGINVSSNFRFIIYVTFI